jgi:hypothetical protein
LRFIEKQLKVKELVLKMGPKQKLMGQNESGVDGIR